MWQQAGSELAALLIRPLLHLSLRTKVKELLKLDRICQSYCKNRSGFVLSGAWCSTVPHLHHEAGLTSQLNDRVNSSSQLLTNQLDECFNSQIGLLLQAFMELALWAASSFIV